ncbi:MAG: TolC family protein [Pseudobdellovibrionaceae bacterium]|nr:TolC family protein [Pseudobdellovibrionaceae bacterium]
MTSFSSYSIAAVFLLAAFQTRSLSADTKRMQDVATLLGIESANGSPASKEAEAAVARLVDRGLKSHPNLQTREAELQASRARVDAAQGTYQPKLQINANAMRQQIEDLKTDVKSRRDSHDINLVLRENLWRGGQDAGQVDLARQDQSLAEIRNVYEGEGLSFRIARVSLDYNFRFFRQLIDEASLVDAVELRSLADRKFNAGQVGKIDLHLTGMRESGSRAAAARAAIDTRQAYLELLNALGPQEPSEALTQDIQALTKSALPFPSALPELKDIQTPTLNEQNSLIVQKRAEITLDQGYRGRYLPQIDLVGTLGRNNASSWLMENDDQKANSRSMDRTVQLQFSWNLWDRTQDYLIRAAAAEKNAATSEVNAVRHEANMEVQSLKAYIVDLHKSLSISRDAYRQAGELYDAQRKLYEAGVIGIQPLMDAEREKRDAIGTWHQSVHELQLSLLRWQALQKGYLTSGSIPSSEVARN